MTTAELNIVIARFRSGRSVEFSNYHAGERIVWEYDAESERFRERTMGAWSEDRTEHYTEERLREKLAPLAARIGPERSWFREGEA